MTAAMHKPQPRRSFWQRLLSRAAGGFLYSASIEVVESSKDRVVLSVSGRLFIADTATREVSSEGQVVAHFDAVKSVVIRPLFTKGEIVWWAHNLSQRHGGEIFVGRTANDVEASVAAARLGTVLGVEVLAPAVENGA